MSTAKPGGLRVVLDTNVYFSAFTHPQGVPFRIWLKALSRDYTLFSSPDIVRELACVLRTESRWAEAEVIRYLKLLTRTAEIVVPDFRLQVVCDDPDDDRILECAVSGRADLIVSGDRHLRRMRSYQRIGIVRPVDFLRTLV